MTPLFENDAGPVSPLIVWPSRPPGGPFAERLASPLVLAGLTMLGNLSPSAEPINVMKGVPQAMLAGAKLQKELERRQVSQQAALRALRQAGFGGPARRRFSDGDQHAPGADFVAREVAPAEAELTGQPQEAAVPDVATHVAFGQAPQRVNDNAPPRADEIAAARLGQPPYRKGQTATNWRTGERRVFDGQNWVPR